MKKLDVFLPFDYLFNLDDFIKKFEDEHTKYPGKRMNIEEADCKSLCIIIRKIFSLEKSLLEIPAPTKVCGDIHGQWYDLMRIFQYCGPPAIGRYLFLGDYVDRGTCSLETVCVLFAYKIKYPNRIFLLRGNHESAVINKVYGFYQEVMERYDNDTLFHLFNNVFDYLPIAALVDGTIFCCHGGLSPVLLDDEITDLRKEIINIKRPIEIPSEGMICDLLWSDPIDLNDEMDHDFASKGWALNSRGCSFVFNENIVKQFLAKFNLELIVRAHQVVPDGYEFFCNRSLVTLFSVSNYCGTFDNAAAVLIIEQRKLHDKQLLQGAFQVLTPDKTIPAKWVKMKKKKKKDSKKSEEKSRSKDLSSKKSESVKSAINESKKSKAEPKKVKA